MLTFCRKLFYIDTGDIDREEYPKIYASAMDGSSSVAIVTNNLNSPLYVAVDNSGFNGRIYWTDSFTNQISSATLDGRDVRQIVGEQMF